MKEPIKLRAHHGMCLRYFVGKGYSNDFVKNMLNIKEELKTNPRVLITASPDVICKFCPGNVGGICDSQDKVDFYDKAVLSMCNISDGTVMQYLDFENLVHKNILSQGRRKEICRGCEWDELCND
ncbi:MAG: DUF1284 domain-containing protein [Clostridiales bacterium]|nr:DUF1284 domain-containing protein [Clostridiales bacterium]